jgi:Dit-like tail protein
MADSAAVNKFFCSIDGFVIDAILSESHTLESSVTEFPIERGADITDNVLPRPIIVEMECLVSNTPIGTMADIRKQAGQIGEVISDTPTGSSVVDHTPVDDAYAHLLKIRNAREPVSIITTLQSYDNMVLKNLSIPRASGRGDEFRFTATFQQVEIVSNARNTRVAIPIANPSKTVKRGLRIGKVTVEDVVTRSIRMLKVGTDSTWYWFDDDIGGYRQGVTRGHYVSNGGTVRYTDQQNWYAHKLRPYGATEAAWLDSVSNLPLDGSDSSHLDAFWRTQESNAKTIAKTSGVNPYDPFDRSAPAIGERTVVLAIIEPYGFVA